ncbi:S-crystallin SL11 [Patella vulgata]|uniref:S-crystallin SL11 n=1 Tax=Patella vulgata TaxID=6465 RepID=UPI00217F93B3|nr:S-crystallin SL11 [Patella vulgata]
MPKYKLYYFNLRGRVELARLCFVAAGVEFDDVRIPIDKWSQVKSTTPYGELPYMEIDGIKVTQSLAIARYLAGEFDLFGSTTFERLRIDESVELVEDFRKGFVTYYREKDATKKKQLMDKFEKDDKPKYLGIFSKLLSDNSSGYLIGNKLSLADLALYDVMQYPLDQSPDLFDNYSKLRDHRNRIETNAKIQDYLRTRPKSAI